MPRGGKSQRDLGTRKTRTSQLQSKYGAGIRDVWTEVYFTGNAHVGVNADGPADDETTRAKSEGLGG